jgi:hypothetical protein
MRQAFFFAACPCPLSLIIYYLSISLCRFKRQISDKPQVAVLQGYKKTQDIVKQQKKSPVFGITIKYRAV